MSAIRRFPSRASLSGKVESVKVLELPGAVISSERIEAVRASAPIKEVIEEYGVALKHSGSRLFGLCPFHSERTASFNVRPAERDYHCFGCGVHGDVFDFVSRIENTGFRGSVQRLAARSGITLDARPFSTEEAARRKEFADLSAKLADILRIAELRYLDELHAWYALRRSAQARLIELQAGACPRFRGESADFCWEALKLVADSTARADTAYCIAALSSPADRAAFALHPEQRAQMIDSTLERGYVADARGYQFQVAL